MNDATIDPLARPGNGTLGILTLCAAIGVGTIYFPQALTPAVAEGLGVSESHAALIATAPQLGYAFGILTIVPLGDVLRHRRILVALFLATAAAAATASIAPSLSVLLAASLLMGVATVAAPVIGPMIAVLTGSRRQGFVSGVVLSGCIAGMILSRAAASLLAQVTSWRAPYAVASALAVGCAVLVLLRAPSTRPQRALTSAAYVLQPLRLLAAQPQLRRSCVYQACVFAGFTATWTTLVLVLRDQFGLSASAIGLITLVALATMAATPWVGQIADRAGPDAVNTWTLAGVVAAAAVLALATLDGVAGLVCLVVGVLILDVAMQSGMVANVTRIYRLEPARRSAMNTAYMTCAFLAGGAGSWCGVRLYDGLGWLGVCGMIGLLAAVALTFHLRRGGAPAPAPQALPVRVCEPAAR